ncbi:MAG: ABATE domain-containing protein [Gemmatimonadaceae bacterium]
MTNALAPLSWAPDRPFRYVGGDPAIELLNTVNWTSRGLEEDRLSGYDRLTRWAEGAGVLIPRLGAQFRTLAAERPGEAEEALREARKLRGVLREIFRAVAERRPAAKLPTFRELNASLSRALAQLQLVGMPPSEEGGPAVQWSWKGATERLDSITWPVVRSAAELLISDEAGRIRECEGVDCGWMYVDRSRNGFRRWCQMESCGTREKSRRRAGRRRKNPG